MCVQTVHVCLSFLKNKLSEIIISVVRNACIYSVVTI